MDAKKPLRVNVIGRGPWGQNIVRTLKELGAEVPIVANRETGWMAAFEGNPDRICVAAHPSINLPVVLECDKRGIPVWIEKPAALCLADVERMARCKVPIFVDYTYLYARTFDGACADVTAGIMSGRCHDFGALYDWAPHALAIALSHWGLLDWALNKKHDAPLANAVESFLGGTGLWSHFHMTLQIHRIIDRAEKLHARR